jgi:hypothetical protein
MSGFGSGNAGLGAFGEDNWSRRVLFDLFPDIYKSLDKDHDGALEALSVALAGPFNILRRKIRDFLDIRDPRTARTEFNGRTRLVLGPLVAEEGEPEQGGVNAQVNTFLEFFAPNGRFSPADIGKSLEISGSVIPTNNGTFTITALTDSRRVLTNPLLATDSGLRWFLRGAVDKNHETTTVEVWGGDVSSVSPDWRINDGYATFTVASRSMFPVQSDARYLTEREGTDGVFALSTLGNTVYFFSKYPFSALDMGKTLSTPSSSLPANLNQWQIGQPLDASLVPPALTGYSGIALTGVQPVPEAGPLYFAVLPRPRITLTGSSIPKGIVEQYGSDMTIVTGTVSGGNLASGATLKSITAKFSVNDEGKVLRLWNTNLDLPVVEYVIPVGGVVDSKSLLTAGPIAVGTTFTTSSVFTWELRTRTALSSDLEVYGEPPSMLALLAEDYGIEVNKAENEARQRGWVRYVSDWIDKKGTVKSYQIMGDLTGYTITVLPLYSVSKNSALGGLVPNSALIEVPITVPGKFGVDGSLSYVFPRLRFSSPTANFRPTEVGKIIRLTGAASALTNKLYTIYRRLDANTVEFTEADYDSLQPLPDAHDGAIGWQMAGLYTTLPPLIPLYDETNITALQEYVGTAAFHVDMFAWESGFNTKTDVYVSAAVRSSAGRYSVTVADIVALDYTGLTGSVFGVGRTITGATSGATGVVRKNPVAGTVIVSMTSGTFGPTEVINGFDASGSADSATLTPLTGFSSGVRPGSPKVISLPEHWTLTDATGNKFFVDTTPTLTSGVSYACTVQATQSPAIGAATLEYVPPESFSDSGYGKTSKIYVTYTAKVAPEAPELTGSQFVSRLAEVVPAHVSMVVNLPIGVTIAS